MTTNLTPADVVRPIADGKAAGTPETIFVWLNPAPDHYGGGWDTDPTNRNIRYVRYDVVDAALRAMQAERDAANERARMNSFAGEGYVFMERRAEAAEAKLAEVEKERDRPYDENVHRIAEQAEAEATIATLTAQVEALRRAVDAAGKLGRIIGFLGDDEARISAFLEASGPELIDRARAAFTTENQTNG